MADEMLRIEGVSKSFGPTLANKDINLVLKKHFEQLEKREK